jgi:hypothetical protein
LTVALLIFLSVLDNMEGSRPWPLEERRSGIRLLLHEYKGSLRIFEKGERAGNLKIAQILF